jgi:hypothetical protein
MALQILVIIAQPADAPPFDADRAWETVRGACAHLRSETALERLPEATEPALKRRLAAGPVHVLFFIGHGHARQGVGYNTLLLEGSGRKARGVNAQYFADLLGGRVPLVVLCAVADGAPFAGAPEALVAHGVGAAIGTRERLDDWGARTLLGQVLAALDAGQALVTAVASLGAAFECALDLRRAGQPLVTCGAVAPAAPPAPATADDIAAPAKCEFERKRAAGEFDVFLCHSTDDKPTVKHIGKQLKRCGFLPWLDEWELAPGVPWQQQLEAQIANIRAAAVFVGRAGIGPWQQEELAAFLSEFHRRKCPVIPTLLPDAPAQPRLPIFLSERTWVDFRVMDPDPLQRLIWGITGRRPTPD